MTARLGGTETSANSHCYDYQSSNCFSVGPKLGSKNYSAVPPARALLGCMCILGSHQKKDYNATNF